MDLGLALLAGLLAALNPCGFAMLPAYLALVVRGESNGRPVGRALVASIAMCSGFLVVFAAFGLLTVTAASVVMRYLPFATMLIGALLAGLGIWLLAGRDLSILAPKPAPRWLPTARLGSMFGYGVSYAMASVTCTVGPFLAVTGIGVGGATLADTVAAFVAYAAGFGLIVGATAIGAAFAGAAVTDGLRRALPYVNRISGALLVIVGAYVGYYGFHEVRLMRGGDPDDPVIAAAARLQGALAGWVSEHGAWPWLLAVAVLGIGALGRVWRRRVVSRRTVAR
ncbi:cytochrome c biogenesis CcdA family protein [Mycobacterium sp. E740]|uniref:cytochrome c biogenesis CcdA family protein n=1 Tax=Mycobacterium sp. E740 TaxID=1834149 RepID=UPI0007FD9022|nr:cytochrome c biogenesis protein CcdA [Mycobacterium sp. E740]OBI77245.1 hypothetical protein A5663_22205 [Mycobacterium sp. E740]